MCCIPGTAQSETFERSHVSPERGLFECPARTLARCSYDSLQPARGIGRGRVGGRRPVVISPRAVDAALVDVGLGSPVGRVHSQHIYSVRRLLPVGGETVTEHPGRKVFWQRTASRRPAVAAFVRRASLGARIPTEGWSGRAGDPREAALGTPRCTISPKRFSRCRNTTSRFTLSGRERAKDRRRNNCRTCCLVPSPRLCGERVRGFSWAVLTNDLQGSRQLFLRRS